MKISKFFIFTVLFCISMSLFSLFFANESENAYEDKEKIEHLIIDGAGYFLKSHSEFIYFLQKIEVSQNGIDYAELNQLINSVVDNMEKANNAYNKLYHTAKVKPYNQEVIYKLLNFDYTKYRDKIKPIPSIYESVQFYLSSGDVTDLYLKVYSDTYAILTSLYEIKNDIEENTTPGTAMLWRINQEYTQSILFGQYAAEIFSNL